MTSTGPASCARLPLVVLALLAQACVAYNEECTPYVPEPGKPTGYLAADIDLGKSAVRLDDHPIGQLVAEAYATAFADRDVPAQLALVNSGAIRSEGVCAPRAKLRAGVVPRSHLREVLPFDNRVVLVDLTHEQLKNVFEHAVARYSRSDPRGAFLQIYRGLVSVDCTRPGEQLDSEGKRVAVGERVTRIALVKSDQSLEEIPLTPPSKERVVRVALDSYLLGGGDGFQDVAELSKSPPVASAGETSFEIVSRHFALAYPEGSPLSATPIDRIALTGCQ